MVGFQETNQGYYVYQTSSELDDLTETKFRVIAIDIDGYESFPLEYVFDMRRNPDPPKVKRIYDGTNLTFSERT